MDIESITNTIINADCMDILKQLPDKCIDLILTDPPYGINIAKDGIIGGANCSLPTNYGIKQWDNQIPTKEIFNEMFRISKNQIIFGGNYFVEYLSNSPCWIVWDKQNTGNYADCELAWTSFSSAIRKFVFIWNGMIQQDMKNKEVRIHPTQKPVGLLEKILREYYDKESKGIVADFFSGSGSVAVACWNLGIPFISVEKNLKHYEDSVKRLQDVQSQMKLFRGIL